MKFPPFLYDKEDGHEIRPLTYEELVQRLELAEAVCHAQWAIDHADRGSQAEQSDKEMTEAWRKWYLQALDDNRW
jgi:hypothetical protein